MYIASKTVLRFDITELLKTEKDKKTFGSNRINIICYVEI